MFLRLFTFLMLMLSALLLAGESSRAEERRPTEYDVKAAYLYNFAKFVEWPPAKSNESRGGITVGIIGRDPFGPALAAIEGKIAGGRKIRIRREVPLQQARNCDIIFIAGSEREELERVLEAVGDPGVLTVGDTRGFAERGVMINFYMEGKTVRFEINQKAAGRAGLKISSSLLRIARLVGE